MAEGKPPITVELEWQAGLQFEVQAGPHHLVADGDSGEGPSPMQLVAAGLASCMAADVVHILTRGRHDLTGLSVQVTAARAAGTPAYYTGIRLHVRVVGDVPAGAVERALQLSRETYCSVWHSLRPDIELTTTFDVTGGR